MSDREYLTGPFDEEEERVAAVVHPAVRSYMYSPMGGDSDSPDEDTVKCTGWTDGARCVSAAVRVDRSSDSGSTTSSDSDSDGGDDADYRTLTPSRRLDISTRRDEDFKWMPTEEATAEPKSMEPREDYCSASLDRRRRTSGDRSDRDRKTRSSLPGKPPQHPSSVRASPRPRRPREEDSELQRRWNSYEQFRWPQEHDHGMAGPWWPPMCWCRGPPPPPPCCMHDRSWPSHPSLPPVPARTYKSESEDRVRRLEADKERLQLQVQVLSEQVAAQADKMADLERALLDAGQRLDDADQRLQKEMLQRSSLETQKLELLSKLSEMRLRVAERGALERSPPPEPCPVARPPPPRTPPANYGRQIERNTHMYSSLPRSGMTSPLSMTSPLPMTSPLGKLAGGAVVARGRGQSVPNLAERDEVTYRGSPSPSLRETRARLGSCELARGPLRATAAPRLQRDRPAAAWQTTDIREWDCETTCGFLESLGLECYVPSARSWLTSAGKGVLAAASAATIDKELQIKHPMHRKKIILAVTDLLGGHGDPHLTAAGQLDTPWALRWLEDVGVCGARAAAAEASLDGRLIHRLSHTELHASLKVHQALHALSVRRGIQVLRDNDFSPDVMIRRASEPSPAPPAPPAPGSPTPGSPAPAPPPPSAAELARWSSHRVMQWLKEIDLAEYAPNLRGAGVHGGLILLEPRFTGELLAALLNIPPAKTLLRRHLTQRFNDLLGRDVIQQKRNAEQTLGYHPLTTTTKYKVPKRSQFSLKRRKGGEEPDEAELVCPRAGAGDDSDDESKGSFRRRVGCLSPA